MMMLVMWLRCISLLLSDLQGGVLLIDSSDIIIIILISSCSWYRHLIAIIMRVQPLLMEILKGNKIDFVAF